MKRRAVVTGGFSYIGAAVARELLSRGYRVHTLTNRRPRDVDDISAAPLHFELDHLTEQLRGADVFVNTFWIRLPFVGQTFVSAVDRSRLLIDAAARAQVKRLVHVSVSNAEAGTNLGYYAGKAQVEAYLARAGLSHAIVRPTLVVGATDVLTNNIAWFLRRFPFFAMPGHGRYRIQPITLEDTARIIADAAEASADQLIDAAGPEVMSFDDYVRLVARACGVRRWVVHTPRWLALATLRLLGLLLRDIVLTKEEILGLEQELLISASPPLGRSSVTRWLMANGDTLGRHYTNDLHRHFGAGADRVWHRDGDAQGSS